MLRLRFLVVVLLYILCCHGVLSDDFVVSNIVVDEDGADVVEAKAVGLAKANRKAFSILLYRLFPGMSTRIMKSLDGNLAFRSTLSFQINKEFFTEHSYKALVSYYFDYNQIQSIEVLNANSSDRKGLIVIPVFYDMDGNMSIWENGWWEAWNRAARDFIVPVGDLEDLAIFNNELMQNFQLLRQEKGESLHKIMHKYHADEIVFVEAHESQNEIFVFVERPISSQVKKLHYYYSPENYDSLSALFSKVVDDLLKRINDVLYSPKVKIGDDAKDDDAKAINYLIIPASLWHVVVDLVLKNYHYSIDYISSKGVLVRIDNAAQNNIKDLEGILTKLKFDFDKKERNLIIHKKT